MARTKLLTNYTYSPTKPASENAIREQIDDAIQEVYDDSVRSGATVNTTGDQTIADIKTFTSSPIVPTPTTPTQTANKSYVDGVAISATIPLNSLTDDYLVDTAGQIKDRVATNTTNIGTNTTNLDILRKAKLDTGVADAYIVDTEGTFSRADGNILPFIPSNTNTGASTMNEDGNGVVSIIKYADGAWIDLEEGDLNKFQQVQLVWNATESAFQLAPKGGNNIKNIQRGSSGVSTGLASRDITISQVDTSKSIIKVTSRAGVVSASELFVKATFLSSTVVRFECYGTTTPTLFAWEVIEFNNVKSKQSGVATLTTAQTINITISSVDINKVLVFTSQRINDSNASATGAYMATETLTTATNLEYSRYNGSVPNTGQLAWQVIEFN